MKDGTSSAKFVFGDIALWHSQIGKRKVVQQVTICGKWPGRTGAQIILNDCFFPDALEAFAAQEQKEKDAKRKEHEDEWYNDRKVEAWVAAQDFVLKRIKSPSTASFGGLTDFQDPTECVQYRGNAEYLVTGWVDAQNAFGATVRTDFSLRVRINSDESFTLIGGPVLRQR